MIKRIILIALAFTGLMVGAGMATGQETVQYFMSFGTDGIWGVLLAGAIIDLIMPLAVLVLTAGLAYPFYRLGRVVAEWPVANALIFAVLTVVLLVGIPLTLYILSNPSL